MADDTEAILGEFRSQTCACGARKCASRAFCSNCYFSLPVKIRGELCNSFGQGYEQAYIAARSFVVARAQEQQP